jgi:hypothetical protein
MIKKSFLTSISILIFHLLLYGYTRSIETDRLIVRDVSGSLSKKELESFAVKVDSLLTKVLRFWSSDPRIDEAGKIILEYDNPLKNNVAASYFFFREEKNKRCRVVKVFGGFDNPHQLAHKLTSALFPNPDIMIRNMMGEASEMRFGNPMSFPMCGFQKDEWILAIIKAGSFIPLAEMGSEQADWGKEIVDNVPTVNDRVKQHTCYLEAGSFGEYLIDTYGIMKMKQFYRQSRNKPRPWEEVYGVSLKVLEEQWLNAIKTNTAVKAEHVLVLLKLWKEDPSRACFIAQDQAKGNARF